MLEVERYAQPDGEQVYFEIHVAGVAGSDGYLIVYLPDAAVADTHHSDIDFDGHVVCRESDEPGREAEFEVESALESPFYGAVGGEPGLRAAEEELDVGVDSESFRVSEGDVSAVCRRERIGVLQRVVVIDAEVGRGVPASEADVCTVEFQEGAAIDETHADGRVVAQRVCDHGAELEGITFGGYVVDDQDVVIGVVVRGVGYSAAENPLSFGDEDRVSGADAAFRAALVYGFGGRSRIDAGLRRSGSCLCGGSGC